MLSLQGSLNTVIFKIVSFILEKIMNKKDRIALVLSFIPFIFAILLFTGNKGEQGVGFIIVVLIAIYWGYRFIKNDISFLGNKVED